MPIFDFANEYTNSFVGSLDLFVSQVLLIIPKLIFAYLIWLVGKWLINLIVKFVHKLDIKKYQFDDKARETFLKIFVPAAKIILFLVILDTFGIGSSIIQAVFNAIALSIAIALGLAFGKALEPEAKQLTDIARFNLRSQREKTTTII